MQGKGDIIVGLDIGTTKICAVVGEVTGREVNIIGIGTYPSIGLRKGVVVNIESTVDSIKKAVEEAELMAGCEISSVYAGIAGGHITGFNSRGIVAIKGLEINQQDVDRVIDAARAVAIPMDREVIHVLPQEFIVDDQAGIQNPVGMAGVRLEAKIHIVTGAVTSAHNIVKCANRSGLDVCDIVLESLASGEAVLTEEEKELGTALLDLGGGTSDLAIFSEKNIKHTFVLALGGNNLTNDIAIGLRAPLNEVENIKKKYGTCLPRQPPGRRDHRGAGHGRPQAPQAAAPDSGRDSGTAHGGDLHPDQAGDLSRRHGKHDRLRGGPDRRYVPAGRRDRGGRIDFRPAGASGQTPGHQRAGGRGQQPHVRHRGRAGNLRAPKSRARSKKFRIRDGNIFNRVMTRMRKWFKEVI
ncbi:MAG: cell division protein FtsA [Desulfobacterales bacterium]|nr:cell division protein FtsA [Desulfobacterales bacterium]